MRKNRIIVLLSTLIVLLFAFAGCSAGDSETTFSGGEADLSGVWILDDDFSSSGIRIPDRIEFFSDGTVQSEWGGTYTVDGNRLNVSYSAMDSYSYTFTLNSDELILKSSGEYSSDATEYRYIRESAGTDDSSGLAASCDEILAEGTNENGDTYQLVLNYAENVNGEETVGVIKNDEWLIDLSETPCSEISSEQFSDRYSKNFVLNNSFQVGQYIWNVENQTVYSMNDNSIALLSYTDYSKNPYRPANEEIINESKFVVCISYDENTYYIANEETMKVEKELPANMEFGPYSEGLIYGENNDGERGFYDEAGNKVINLNNYYVGNKPVFINGQSIIYTYSDSGEIQYITIDKAGNVLSIE